MIKSVEKKETGGVRGMYLRGIYFFVAFLLIIGGGVPVEAQKATDSAGEQETHVRGRIAQVSDSTMTVTTRSGTARLTLPNDLTVLKLSKASFVDVAFGVYVGSVSKRLDAYSPIVRDSLSWLHQGFELRIFDEALRGLALGHTSWDLHPGSVMTHGWVDDMEVRVLSIKYGPTEEEETDVDVPHDVPIRRMSVGDRSLLKSGAYIFSGAQKGEATFVIVGEEGIIPQL